MEDDFILIDKNPAGLRCAVCADWPELYSVGGLKVMCCRNNSVPALSEQGGFDAGCLLFMPPKFFQQPTQREAIAVWDKYQRELVQHRSSNLLLQNPPTISQELKS